MADHRHNRAAHTPRAMCALCGLVACAAPALAQTDVKPRLASLIIDPAPMMSLLASEPAPRERPQMSQTLLSKVGPDTSADSEFDQLGFQFDRDAEEDRTDPLRPRRGGEVEFLESRAGDLSLGFGLVRAGRASAREKDRRLESFEPAHMSVHGAAGPVQVLDAGLGWRFRPDRAVTFSFEGGLRTLTSAGPDADNDSATYSDLGDEPITLPVVGASLQWDPLAGLRLHGGATGHMNDRQGTFVDLYAEAQIDLTGSTDLVAGYRFLDASFESRTNRARLSQDALYAGLRIRY